MYNIIASLDSLTANLVCIVIVAAAWGFIMSRTCELDGQERYEGREQRKLMKDTTIQL